MWLHRILWKATLITVSEWNSDGTEDLPGWLLEGKAICWDKNLTLVEA